ncbi:MAG: di-trans,poly-cis-decaprenylcistransferase [Candidatus Poseidoniales archaeon]|nr:MAG: di-trans,poly-cis-decaprenylcistransferase [Candidatus Poseidoniales archaeon]|tara:strand:+ start:256 stop:1137 length:882 start_codon:yes stop_codon:yes gene_type:complete
MGNQRSRFGRGLDSLAKWLLKFRLVSIPAKSIANSKLAWSLISRSDRVRANRLRERLITEEMPRHVSIIMDGNRRFAWNNSSKTAVGHSEGKEKLKEVMDWVLDLGVPYFTVYALSTENISERDSEELEILYDLYVSGLDEISVDPRIHDRGVRVQVVGRLDMLPQRVKKSIENAESVTSQYTDFTFTVCLAYGGREEIVDAVKSVAADHASGDLDIDSINSSEITKRMYAAELPDPDLVIRTSGEERISNFLLWQIAYSELHFTDVFWPSFSKSDLYEAIESYQYRRRRYGG